MRHPSQTEMMHLFPTQFLPTITPCFHKAKQDTDICPVTPDLFAGDCAKGCGVTENKMDLPHLCMCVTVLTRRNVRVPRVSVTTLYLLKVCCEPICLFSARLEGHKAPLCAPCCHLLFVFCLCVCLCEREGGTGFDLMWLFLACSVCRCCESWLIPTSLLCSHSVSPLRRSVDGQMHMD